jgi:hypothetical protein
VRPADPAVTLTALKERAAVSDAVGAVIASLPLLRQPRLSVQELTSEQWDAVVALETAMSKTASVASTATATASSAESNGVAVKNKRRIDKAPSKKLKVQHSAECHVQFI